MKKLVEILRANGGHWVGDGFPVRTLFSYHGDTKTISLLLLFDYAGPHLFEPNAAFPRAVGQHSHCGFETVTCVFEGEVGHRESGGGVGTSGWGDVQWMQAPGGINHKEYNSKGVA